MFVRLAEYIESEPARKQAQKEAQKAKLEALEKKLGIDKNGNGEPLPPRKHRLDDTEYIEESKEIVDSVKSAVAAGAFRLRYRLFDHLMYRNSRYAQEEEEGQDFC